MKTAPLRRPWCACALALLVATVPGAMAQDLRLPAVNLRAEWRWVDGSMAQQQAAGASGSVTVGTGGIVSTQGQVTLRSESRALEGEVLQQVLVRNGAQAGLRLSAAVPLQWVEAVQGPRGTAGVLRQSWVEAVTGVQMRPRWQGGRAPVDLELTAESVPSASTGTNALDPPALRNEQARTRVLVPLGEWVTVASSAELGRARQQGTVSTTDIERRAVRELQVRISAP